MTRSHAQSDTAPAQRRASQRARVLRLGISRAMIVPSLPRRTLVLGVLGFAGFVLSRATMPWPAELELTSGTRARGILKALLWSTAGSAVSRVASTVIHSLRRRALEARQLGQYSLEEKIGGGGMGEVYRARAAHDWSEAAAERWWESAPVRAAAGEQRPPTNVCLHPAIRRVLSVSMACALALASAARVSAADEPQGKQPQSADTGPEGQPQSVAVDLKRLGMELDLYAAEASRTRLATALTGLGIGALLVPSGIVLLGRTDGVSRALVIGMVIGGSAQVVSVPLVFIPTRMDEIRRDFMKRPASVESKATIREIENEWRLAAEASRRKRGYLGTTLLVVGTVHLATGLTLLLAPEGIVGMSRKNQYTWGGVTMGVGVPVTTLGVRFLLEWSLEEISWQAYRTMKSDAGSLSRLRAPLVGVAPVPEGALAFVTLPF